MYVHVRCYCLCAGVRSKWAQINTIKAPSGTQQQQQQQEEEELQRPLTVHAHQGSTTCCENAVWNVRALMRRDWPRAPTQTICNRSDTVVQKSPQRPFDVRAKPFDVSLGGVTRLHFDPSQQRPCAVRNGELQTLLCVTLEAPRVSKSQPSAYGRVSSGPFADARRPHRLAASN